MADDNDVENTADAIQDQGGPEATPVAASVALGGLTAAGVAALVSKQVG